MRLEESYNNNSIPQEELNKGLKAEMINESNDEIMMKIDDENNEE